MRCERGVELANIQLRYPGSGDAGVDTVKSLHANALLCLQRYAMSQRPSPPSVRNAPNLSSPYQRVTAPRISPLPTPL